MQNATNRTNRDIRYAIGKCSLGAVTVAMTDRGVCAIELGNEPDALIRRLGDRFPNIELIRSDAVDKMLARVIAQVEQPRGDFSLPLDAHGTSFQHRVWRALKDIPIGATASYAQVARRIGAPAAVRAVAQACGANPTAVVVPCHRVVRTDGSSGGYRWGSARKQALLERERAA